MTQRHDPARMLAKDVYVIVTRQVDPSTPIAPEMMQAHLARQVELEKTGVMFAAGPMFAEGAERPEAGMIVVRATSFAEADAIAAATRCIRPASARTRCGAGG